jgi:predicted RNase H-like HicB family nuclease
MMVMKQTAWIDAEGAVPPYALAIVWDPEDRIFVVTVPELPGCMTHGATYAEAAINAEEAIASWVGAARDMGDPLPPVRVEWYSDDAPAALTVTHVARSR